MRAEAQSLLVCIIFGGVWGRAPQGHLIRPAIKFDFVFLNVDMVNITDMEYL